MDARALTGRLYCAVVPFLDGRYTVEEIHDLLSGTVSRDHIDHVVDRLRRLGYLSHAVDGMHPGVAAFWSELGSTQAGSSRGFAAARLR